MISAIPSTKGVISSAYDEKRSENKDRSASIADNFRMEQKTNGKDSDAVKTEIDKELSKNDSESTKTGYDEFAKKLQTMLDGSDFSLEFRLDEKSKKMILRIIDNSTKEVVHQYPPEVTLQIARIVSRAMGNESGQVADAKI